MRSVLCLAALMAGISVPCLSAETVVGEADKQSLDISIYNQNLALVKDVRKVSLVQGINDIAFEGVASQIKPETALLYADGVNVLEQNYDYDLLTPNNIIDKSVGATVKTVTVNPTTGANIYDKAEIVSAVYGTPILKFKYGIETNFPGRLVFDSLPSSLRSKPTLVAKLNSADAGDKGISLAYLTNGISWKTDYVAKVSDASKLNLTGWVTITNESGVDYDNARIQLIAGQVNEVAQAVNLAPRMMKMAMLESAAADSGFGRAPVQQDLSGYHLYSLPNKTTIKDKQTKQLSLLEQNDVDYRKEAKIASQLYFSPSSKAKFEQVHPEMYYILNNTEEAHLGIQLPAGVVRFYENDNDGNLQFIGENSIEHVAKGEVMRLKLGSFANIFADGALKQVKKLSENKAQKTGKCQEVQAVYAYEAEINVTNSGNEAQEVVYEQALPQDAKVSAENVPGELKNAGVYEWRLTIPAGAKQALTFTVEAPDTRRVCD